MPSVFSMREYYGVLAKYSAYDSAGTGVESDPI